MPIVINSHTGEGSFFIEKSFKARIVQGIIRVLYKITLRFSSKITFLNYDDKRIFTEKKLIEDEKTEVIRGSGIDTEEWNPSKIRAGKSRKLRVLMASRLIIHKGVVEYVEAAKLLKKKHDGAIEFFLAGDFYDGNPYVVSKEYIKRAVQEGFIKFFGWKKDMIGIVNSSDIFVLPSYREGCPKSVLEAMALQKPIVTTNTVGCKECVENNKNGFLVPPKNVLKLAEAIERLIQDKALRMKFGRYSRQKCIEEFDIKLVVRRHLQMYRELLQKSPGPKTLRDTMKINIYSGMFHRVANFLAALSILAITFPLILIIAAAIKIESKGDVIYKQKRIGKNGKFFVLYKFRTMKKNSANQELITIKDKRISKVGRLLRKSGLDEFPQLWNVVKGDMNLIGPRPEMPDFHKRFSRSINNWHKRLDVKPGITGLAQLNGIDSNKPEEKLKYDLWYINNQNLSLDLKIIFKTLKYILKLENINDKK